MTAKVRCGYNTTHPSKWRKGRTDMPDQSNMSEAVVLITREGMGTADAELQKKLLDTYLRLLLESSTLPGAICFYTEGVKLVVEGSPLLERLGELEQRGVQLISCATCLDYFGISKKVRVGIVGGMPAIIQAQAKASKVITI